ncbi:heparinase II/III family protein [Vreelandella subterranea]|uniref:heparinase II/III family protein n=1 Tax=Vreelandella subterranea TaxID=416874 RepID=UPI001FE03EB3|nr:heparinase II/III family protein [Halomonas subterranea]
MLLLHTVRYLKIQQLVYRVYYRFSKPRLKKRPAPEMRGVITAWSGPNFILPATDDGKSFTFLGETGYLQYGWNNPAFSKLWLYNLHYQDDLNAVGADGRSAVCQQLVENWIDANPPLQGNGWEPYCLSLRIVNWVKWLSRLQADEVDPRWLSSLACQANALAQQLEFHILANHLFANAKALVFAGSFLGGKQGDALLGRGVRLLDQQVPEQFLADGAHYELSPMYHATLLWDMCDLVQLQQQTRLVALDQRKTLWRRVITHGISWLRKMVHPDGDIAFFNDATLGIAPTLKQLEGYAGQLGCVPEPISRNADFAPLQLCHLKSSGYVVIDWAEGHRALLDAAKVGPGYQPGHAHADTLSFELSLFGQRVFVNSGISQYGEDTERHRQRSTAAHNTLEVDGENSSEIWAGFRVARRAKPIDLAIRQQEGYIRVDAAHDGYQRLPGKVLHQRQWLAKPSELVIEDQLSGDFKQAKAYFHLHPDVRLEQVDGNHLQGNLAQCQVFNLSFEGGIVETQAGSWHPAFGVSLPNNCVVVTLQASELKTQISWRDV